jgi:hypothetical protein
MFELHVVVAGFVMFNIMELIMEIVPNYPTNRTADKGRIFRRFSVAQIKKC